MPQEISVRIDGELCRASEGQTILDVARANKKYIPTLCFLEGLSPSGSCRLCLVEVAGVGRLLPACTTPIQNGMSVNTNSEKLLRHRQMAVEFLLLERNHYCAICVCNNHCELQAMAQRLGVTHVRFPYNYPRLPVDVSHERYVLDHNRCILCTRCVRVCAEVEGANVWEISARGINSRLVSELDGPGASRKPAPSAASACKCARRGRWRKKAWRWKK